MNLKNKIQDWERAGLIQAREARAILDFENAQPSKNYVFYGIFAVGVLAISLGALSLVAANWNQISPNFKLISYSLVQCLLGVLYLYTPSRQSWKRSIYLWLFSFDFLVGIGLVAQIFHLSGPLWQLLSFWLLLISLPALLETERKLLSHAWMIVFFITILSYSSKFGDAMSSTNILISSTLIITAIGFNGLTQRIKRLKHFETVALQYGLIATLSLTSGIGNLLWLTMTHPYVNLPLLLIPTVTIVLSAFLILMSVHTRKPPLTKQIVGLISKILFCMVIYLLLPSLLKHYFNICKSHQIFYSIIGALGFIIIWTQAAWIAALQDFKKLYGFFTAIIALRFVGIYFEVFGTLSKTGFGLIITGGVILLFAHLWRKSLTLLVTRK